MEIKDLRTKIIEYITIFREKETELGEIAESRFYRMPCQVTVVWFQDEDKNHDLQLFIFTHWEEEKDLEVDIQGPVKFADFIKFSKNFIAQDKWSKIVNIEDYRDPSILQFSKPFFDVEYNFSKIIEMIMFRAYDLWRAKNYDNFKDISYCYWIIASNIQDKDINTEFEKLFEGKTKVRAKAREDSNVFEGVYTYFYPPLWIGPTPTLLFEDRINDIPFSKLIRGYKTKFKERDLILKSNSYIALEKKEGEIPTEEINLIMALIYLSGKDLRSLSRWDLMPISFEKDTGHPISVGFFEINERSRLHSESKKRISEVFSQEWQSIEEDKIEEIIEKAEIIHDNEEISKNLIFLIESYTHLSRNRYSQSFIMNWIIIERYINTMWQTFIENKGYEGARKRFLKEDTRSWTVATRLEVLNVIGDLSDDEYQIVNRFRKARNKFAHGEKIIMVDLSKECLDFTKSLIVKLIGNFNSSLLPI